MTITAHRLYFGRAGRGNRAKEERLGRAFFGAIRLSNGMFKTTYAGRLDAVNERLNAYLHEVGAGPERLLDVGTSSGETTHEWLESLRRAGFDPEMTATDAYLNACLAEPVCGLRVLTETNGAPLQYDLWGVAVRPWRRRLDYLTGYAWLSRLCNGIYRLSGWPERVDRSQRGGGDPGIRTLPMVTPAVLREDAITFVEADVFQEPPPELRRRFDLVRVANVLNRSVFSPEEIARAVGHLRTTLAGEGGHLLICRTLDDGSHHATLFRLEADATFAPCLRIGAGSEVEDQVVAAA